MLKRTVQGGRSDSPGHTLLLALANVIAARRVGRAAGWAADGVTDKDRQHTAEHEVKALLPNHSAFYPYLFTHRRKKGRWMWLEVFLEPNFMV